MTALLLLAASGILAGASGLPGLLMPAGRPTAQRVATVLHVAGCVLGLAAAGLTFALGGGTARAAWSLPSGFLSVALDPLSAFFLVPILVVSGLGSIYGEGYWPEARHPENGRKLRAFYGLVTAGLVLVTAAGDAWSFLIGWEIVGLSAFFLVTTDRDDPAALRAGWIYLGCTHVATLVLFALFALLRDATGGWELAPSAALGASPHLGPILVLGLVGFGIKAGVIPGHVWLPEAHAAAPSHVSALLSGVVLKMGIYGLVRLVSMLPSVPSWLGLALVGLGVTSGVVGVVWALAQHDLKRLLAYHSIENVGIILIGLGVGALGLAHGRSGWAFLGLLGGLLHVWNHAAFKALLFYAAGSVIHATGTREIDRLGGLLPSMRFTASAFLVGAVAICGLPPLNGFVSEWLVYVGSFRALSDGGTSVEGLGAAAGAPALALIGALAVACFVKAFSAIFLGTPRSPLPEVHEAGRSMRFAMGALAVLCVAVGVWPAGALWAGGLAARSLRGAPFEADGEPGVLFVAPLVVLAALAATALLFGRALGRGRRAAVTWDCGYAGESPRIQYTASSFASSLVELFRWAVLPEAHRPRVAGVLPASGERFESHAPDPVLDRVLLPGLIRARAALSLARVIQSGHIQAYLLYIAVTLVGLLWWSASW